MNVFLSRGLGLHKGALKKIAPTATKKIFFFVAVDAPLIMGPYQTHEQTRYHVRGSARARKSVSA